jgi:uncharacterized protein YbjT (DUF2867 family)
MCYRRKQEGYLLIEEEKVIVVTGANGKLGQLIVEKLLSKVNAEQIGVSVRDPEKATHLAERGVRVRQGDFAEPCGLSHAFEAASQLLLISSNARAFGGDTLAQHRAVIDAARTVGVQRIVYTSHMGSSPSSAFPPMWDHAATETMLQESGVPWIALRNGFYANSAIGYMGREWQEGLIEAPIDGKVSWTAHNDLAEAAVEVLLTENYTQGPTAPLTASEALDLADLAAIASELLDRPVRRKTLEAEELRKRLSQSGMSSQIDIILGLYEASRLGEFATVDHTLAQLLHRPPISVRQVLMDAIAAQS